MCAGCEKDAHVSPPPPRGRSTTETRQPDPRRATETDVGPGEPVATKVHEENINSG